MFLGGAHHSAPCWHGSYRSLFLVDEYLKQCKHFDSVCWHWHLLGGDAVAQCTAVLINYTYVWKSQQTVVGSSVNIHLDDRGRPGRASRDQIKHRTHTFGQCMGQWSKSFLCSSNRSNHVSTAWRWACFWLNMREQVRVATVFGGFRF